MLTDAIDELASSKQKPDRELIRLLTSSWRRIRAFGSLFQLVPVKLRRRPRVMTGKELAMSAQTALALAEPEKIGARVVETDASVRVVPADLDSILINLVSNAVKAIGSSANREKGKLQVSFARSGGNLDIRVADNGSGISDRVKKIMFEPLEGTFAEGTGMGLPIVQFLAERYDGSVWLSEQPPKGYVTEFRVTLKGVGAE